MELLEFVRDTILDIPATQVVIAGDFNGHIFNDVTNVTSFDRAFRGFEQEIVSDGFQRYPEVRHI